MRYSSFEIEQQMLALRELCRSAIETFGGENQLLQTCEELAELTQAISKAKRYGGRAETENVAEEIADVLIMIAQIQIIFGIPDHRVISEYERKTKRLSDLIRAERSAK